MGVVKTDKKGIYLDEDTAEYLDEGMNVLSQEQYDKAPLEKGSFAPEDIIALNKAPYTSKAATLDELKGNLKESAKKTFDFAKENALPIGAGLGTAYLTGGASIPWQIAAQTAVQPAAVGATRFLREKPLASKEALIDYALSAGLGAAGGAIGGVGKKAAPLLMKNVPQLTKAGRLAGSLESEISELPFKLEMLEATQNADLINRANRELASELINKLKDGGTKITKENVIKFGKNPAQINKTLEDVVKETIKETGTEGSLPYYEVSTLNPYVSTLIDRLRGATQPNFTDKFTEASINALPTQLTQPFKKPISDRVKKELGIK